MKPFWPKFTSKPNLVKSKFVIIISYGFNMYTLKSKIIDQNTQIGSSMQFLGWNSSKLRVNIYP
jgi:hypothetical protein